MANTNGSKNLGEARARYKQAEADLKAAGNDKTKKQLALDARKAAGAEIDMFKILNNPNYLPDKTTEYNTMLAASQKNLEAARKKFREVDIKAKAMTLIAEKGMGTLDINLAAKQLNNEWARLYPDDKHTFKAEDVKQMEQELNEFVRKNKNTKFLEPYKAYVAEMKAQRKAQGAIIKKERDINIPKHKRNLHLLNVAAEKALNYKEVREEISGNGGRVDGGDANGNTSAREYKDANGNVVTEIKDQNGNVSYSFTDEKGKKQTIKTEEIQKAEVDVDEIKKALEAGDLEKALTLLFKALTTKNNGYQSASSSKEYTDNANGALFKVNKENGKISSILMSERGGETAEYTAEMFERAKKDPKAVESALESKDYKTAGKTLLEVGDINVYGKPLTPAKLEVSGNAIILTDMKGDTFELTEEYLKAQGVKKGKAKGTIEKLQEALKVSPQPKGLEQAVATYFRGNSAPLLPQPERGNWTCAKLNKTLIDKGTALAAGSSKTTSITVEDRAGNKKKLKAEDFAAYYGCDKKEGKKILRAYARAIEDGANLDDILSDVANGGDKERTRSISVNKDKVKSVGKAVGKGAVEVGKGIGKKVWKDAKGVAEDKFNNVINMGRSKIKDFLRGDR